MHSMGDNSAARLKAIVDHIERIESDIKDMNSDKSEVYKEARGAGFDVKVLREVIKRRRMDASDLSERESLIDTYLAALGTPIATRARTSAIPHDPQTGEIIDIQSAESNTADVAPDAGPQPGCTPPQGEAKVRDSLPNDIIGDMPTCLHRGAE